MPEIIKNVSDFQFVQYKAKLSPITTKFKTKKWKVYFSFKEACVSLIVVSREKIKLV